MLPFPRDRKVLIGVVHLLPLPGAPRYGGSMPAVVEAARRDARALVDGGCDGLIVENFGDLPFFAESLPPESVAAIAVAAEAVRQLADEVPVGVNCLRNDARAALGVCAATGASFVRVNVHTGAAVGDPGLLRGRAAETLRERSRLCPAAAVLADVLVKHAAPLAPIGLADAAEEAVGRGLADGVVVTGRATGSPPDAAALGEVRERIGSHPLFVGSGLDAANAPQLIAPCDGAIVGTSLKEDGRVEAPVDPGRVAALRAICDRA